MIKHSDLSPLLETWFLRKLRNPPSSYCVYSPRFLIPEALARALAQIFMSTDLACNNQVKIQSEKNSQLNAQKIKDFLGDILNSFCRNHGVRQINNFLLIKFEFATVVVEFLKTKTRDAIRFLLKFNGEFWHGLIVRITEFSKYLLFLRPGVCDNFFNRLRYAIAQ